MSELNKRIITAIVLLLAVYGWYAHVSSPWFERGLALIGFVASCELVLLIKLRQPVLYMTAVLVVWAAFTRWPGIELLLLGSFVWFALFVFGARREVASFGDFFAAIWIFGWLFVFALAILQTHASATGRGFIIGACLAVWVSDSAAYFVGRAIGKHRLCPAISPGKSVQGAIGGLLFGVPVAVGCWLYWGVMPLVAAIMLAIVTVLAGMLGDLSESAVKRLVGAKDSGRWLPGHGGILDRIDAIIMAVPVSWILWRML
ncbi:MAG: phosphatidate cytidylyltransferase [Mariprofundus sp.]|nr:phosphatidate cytidylyltransferase [Mariprofundus sp.]